MGYRLTFGRTIPPEFYKILKDVHHSNVWKCPDPIEEECLQDELDRLRAKYMDYIVPADRNSKVATRNHWIEQGLWPNDLGDDWHGPLTSGGEKKQMGKYYKYFVKVLETPEISVPIEGEDLAFLEKELNPYDKKLEW